MDKLGAPQAPAPSTGKRRGGAPAIEQRWDAKTRISLKTGALHITHATSSLTLEADGVGGSPWHRRQAGAWRRTPFGSETVISAAPKTEELLTVTRHVGVRTWRWRLETHNARPRLEGDGSLTFAAAAGDAGFHILPTAIYDVHGRDVTPPAARWSVERPAGSTWLTLRLDDAQLPEPYVIDPIAVVGAPTTGSTKTGSPLTIASFGSPANGNLVIASFDLRDTGATISTPAGWTLLTSVATAGNTTKQYVYYKVWATGDPTSVSWTWTGGSGASDSSAGVIVYSGQWAAAGSAIETSTTNSGTGATASTTAGANAIDNSMITAFYGIAGSANTTSTSGMTARFSVTSTSGAPSVRSTSEGYDLGQATAGTISAKAATLTSSDWTAVMASIKPALTTASAAKSTVTASPGSVTANGTSTSTITATLKDTNGNPVSGKSVTLAAGSGSSTITGSPATTNSSGVATFTVKDSVAQSVMYTATDTTDSATITQSAAVTFVPGPASKLVVTSSTANITTGATRALTAQVCDANDNVVTSDNTTSVTFTQTGGAGSLTGTGAATASLGIASKTVTGGTAGSVTITASAAGLTSGTTTFTVVVSTPTQLVITSSTANLASGSTRTITAEVRDAAGNVVTSDNTTSVTFTQTTGTGTVGTGSSTASAGIASKTVTGSTAGTITITITASATGLAPGASNFSVVAGTATKVVTSSTANLASGSARTLTAEIRDALDNVVTTDNATSVTFAKTAGAGTVTGAGAATASSGVASKSVTAALAGSITVTAFATGLTSGTSTFTIDPGATLLRTTITGGGVDHVVFEWRSGASPWAEIDTDSSAPFTAVFDTSVVPDGLVDLRATAYDAFGNSSTAVASGIGIDNTAPKLASSTPADGSTIASASSIALTATEPIASVDTPTLDGSPAPAPALSGATASSQPAPSPTARTPSRAG